MGFRVRSLRWSSPTRGSTFGYALRWPSWQWAGHHRESQCWLAQVTKDNQAAAPVISSAGALVNGLKVIGAKRIALVAPYMKPLTQLVVDYIQHEGIEVGRGWRALEIPDNLESAGTIRQLPGSSPGWIYARSMLSCCPPACRCLRCRPFRRWRPKPANR